MNRKTIALAVTATLTATASLAQSGPDFSPLPPRNTDPSIAQPSDAPYIAPDTASDIAAPPVTTTNPQLQGYESSAPVLAEPDAVVVESRDTVVAVPAATPSATIGAGLFNRRGPNDFGA